MKFKVLALILTVVAMLNAQPFQIYGAVYVKNAPTSPVSLIHASVSFRIVFQGDGTYLTDSVVAGPNYSNGYSYGKVFNTPWRGKVFIHKISAGFILPTDTLIDTLGIMLGNGTINKNILHNITVIDTAKPQIINMAVSPKWVKVGDTVTLTYTTVDNMWLNAYKRIEISYDNEPWTYVDSLFETNFYLAWPGDQRSNKTQKFTTILPGLCRFRVTVKDYEGNQIVAISDTFRVNSIVSINWHKPQLMKKTSTNNVFDLSGRKINIANSTSKYYVLKGTKISNKLYMK
jgi:hypothetical protein